MSKPHNIFISWSGDRSKWVAEALHNWLPKVLQSARPWVSTQDIEKGTRGLSEMSNALNGMGFGITCLTSENLQAEWILYEAGALSKTFQDDKTRLWTYLLAGLENKDVKPPLGQFQHTKADKDDTRKLIHSVNMAINSPDDRLNENMVNEVFDRWWQDLEAKIKTMPPAKGAVVKERSSDEIQAEVLQLCRQYLPKLDQLLSFTIIPAVHWKTLQKLFSSVPYSDFYPLGSDRPNSKGMWVVPTIKQYKIQLKNGETRAVSGSDILFENGSVTIYDGKSISDVIANVENVWEELKDNIHTFP